MFFVFFTIIVCIYVSFRHKIIICFPLYDLSLDTGYVPEFKTVQVATITCKFLSHRN